jgi:hypothetical protein
LNYLKNYSRALAYEKVGWGREGERDYCLKLSELPAEEQQEFVKGVKDALGKFQNIAINENTPSSHKR